MRLVTGFGLLLVCACAGTDPAVEQAVLAERNRKHQLWVDEHAARAAAIATAEAALTPTQRNEREKQQGEERAARERKAAQAKREGELLERALTGSPDYVSAVRRAAIANVDLEVIPANTSRRQQTSAAVLEARIAAEEARLSDVIESRRRDALAARAMADQAARISAARASCDAQASAVAASVYTPYSRRAGILGSALMGAINSSAAEEQARAGCYRAVGL
jgi:predicted ATP-dependent protease